MSTLAEQLPLSTLYLCDSCGDTNIALVLDDDGPGIGIGPCPDCPCDAIGCQCRVTDL
jgi:hypothetical protein